MVSALVNVFPSLLLPVSFLNPLLHLSLISPSLQLSTLASSFFHTLYFAFLWPSCLPLLFIHLSIFLSLYFFLSSPPVILLLPSPIIPRALSPPPYPLLSLPLCLGVSILPPYSLPLILSFLPCVSGLMSELVHVELASWWRHCFCLIDVV